MADFETRVETLTGLTVSTNPTTAELTEYLKDGVIEVTNRIVALKPEQVELFQRSSSSDSQGVDVGSAQIIYVMREADVDGSSDGTSSWRPCRKIPTSMQSRVVDKDSLFYASIYNPVYAVENNGVINVYPVPSSNNGIKVFYVNEEPRDITNNASLAYNHANIKYFPNDKVYLVVLYAGLRSLDNALAAKGVTIETALTPDDINLPVPPVAPSIDSTSIDTSGLTNPTFLAPVLNAPSWSDTDNWISVEEDSEMLGARVTEINAKIQAYNSDLQSAKSAFDKENVILQKDLSIAQNNAQSYERGILTKYSQEINEYQQNVSGLVAKHTSEIQKASVRLTQYRTDYEWMAARKLLLQREYDTAFIVMGGKSPQLSQQQQYNQEQPRRRSRTRRRR